MSLGCRVAVTLTVSEAGSGKSLMVVNPGTGTTSVVVGHLTDLVPAGASTTVSMLLNQRGKHLLGRFYKLPAMASFAGALKGIAAQTVTLSYGRVDSTFTYTWSFTPRYSQLTALNISGIPTGASVLIVCHGGGCPFGSRTLSATGSHMSVASQLHGARLKPRSQIWFAVTAPGDVGKVALFKVAPGRAPAEKLECLPPGVMAPRNCGS
jgi:hypothetical protein